MNIQVNPHRIILTKTNDVNSGEYNVNECTFEFSQEFDNLTCIAVFSLCDGTTKNITILNNKCIIPTEVLTQPGQVQIGVYGYSVEDNELVLRYSPTPQRFLVTEGSYKEGTEPVAPSPTDWEILVQQVSNNSRDISEIQEDIGNINTDIVNINTAINELDDKKANISDLSAVAFSGSYNDLIDKPNLSVYATKTDLSDEATLRENADVALQEQIDAISVSSDVVDVVGTYQELLNYDTQHLKDNDIVKVLDDSTHNDALSYYRWDKETSTWSYVGSEGPFYTKAETQELLNTKENKITTTNKLDADLVDDSNSTNKFVTESDITNWNNKEDKSNKVTSISSSSTDTQYPSAKCVYDSQEEQNEQIAELEMLYNAFPTVSAENETIQLDNTAKVKFREIDLKGNTSQVVIPEEQGTSVSNTSINVSDVNTDKEHTIEMSGNTYQETTTGKNLWGGFNYSKVISGLTCTYNIDGTITINGTASDNATTTTVANAIANNIYVELKPGTYTASCDNLISGVSIEVYDTNSNGKTNTFTLTETTNIIVRLRVVSGTIINNINFKLQLESGSTATNWEKFTYGTSPNPDYPQPIEVVTGTNNVEVCGKNLFDKNATLYNGYITQTGEINSSANFKYTDYIPIAPSTTYTTSGMSGGTGSEPSRAYYDKNKNFISGYRHASQIDIIDTSPSNAYYMVESVRISDLDTVMIEKGSTASTYEQYQGNTYPINLGNIELCKIGTYQDRIYKRNNKWYLEKNIEKAIYDGSDDENLSQMTPQGDYYRYGIKDTSIKNDSTLEKTILNYSNYFRAITFKNRNSDMNNTIYTICNNNVSNSAFYINTPMFTSLSDFKNWLSTHNTTVYYVLATPTDTQITDTTLVNQLNALYSATIYSTTNINTTTSNLLPYIDLHYNFVTPSPSPSRPSVVNVVKGNNTITISNSDNTESQTFPINIGNMELCKIGTYQDYIYESNGNWFKKGNIGKVVLNGSENWLLELGGLRFGYYSIVTNALSTTTSGYCTHYATFERYAQINNSYGVGTDFYRLHNDLGFETASAFKTWLSSNNITIYYPLNTPTDTQITDTTLITQLNNIKKAYSYDTQTNISQTNTDKPFIIYAEAIRSLKDLGE